MHVMNFSSYEEMLRHLRKSEEAALASLHPAQHAITFGDYWTQFVDIPARHVVFGRVHSLSEVRNAERRAGATPQEADEVVANTETANLAGFLYSRAYDRYNATGELGSTHKANVWPIDESTFNAFAEADWLIDNAPLSAKVNLQVAYTAIRLHRGDCDEER